jgi:hypothetical protein
VSKLDSPALYPSEGTPKGLIVGSYQSVTKELKHRISSQCRRIAFWQVEVPVSGLVTDSFLRPLLDVMDAETWST